MLNKTILIIEDDLKLAKFISYYLRKYDFKVTMEHQGDRGLYRLTKDHPDLVILDVMLPKMNGIMLCREARQYYDGLILLLTGSNEDGIEINGLENGADDFVRKPIDLHMGKLHIDASNRAVYWEENYIHLSDKEFEILYFLANHAGKPVNRANIMQALKGFDYDGISRTIDITISSLRKKFNDKGRESKKIKTVWGRGYLFIRDAWE